MPSLNNLVAKLRTDYPNLSFLLGDITKFTPPTTIFYTKDTTPLELLHELGHYLIQKNDYSSNIELIRIESEAWQKAAKVCEKYQITWDEDYTQDHLDSYRNWLHFISLCKNCQLAGYEDSTGNYHCPLCNTTWKSTPPPREN